MYADPIMHMQDKRYFNDVPLFPLMFHYLYHNVTKYVHGYTPTLTVHEPPEVKLHTTVGECDTDHRHRRLPTEVDSSGRYRTVIVGQRTFQRV